MTGIKICGITNLEDGMISVEAGANSLGFILAPSPREVTYDQATKIVRQLPPFVLRVGVISDKSSDDWKKLLNEGCIDLLQVHGDSIPKDLPANRIIKVFSIGKDNPDNKNIDKSYRGILLDTYHPKKQGGTGEIFPWEQADKYKNMGCPLILAGGLCPENILSALDKVRPDAVDISSGVEDYPGKKDPKKVKLFIRIIKEWDNREGKHGGG